MEDFDPFHSAVNRIPVLRASGKRAADKGWLPRDLFTDFPAPGHDHLDADRLSGSIDLEMTVKTPLVFGEQSAENKGGKKPRTVKLPETDEKRLIVPPTMVKGMISRAYEALTCSRFRVFGDNSQLLTYRADPAAANGLLPGRVFEQENGGLAVEILDGFGKNAQVALIRDDLNNGYGTIMCTNHPDIRPGPGGRINPQQVFTRFRRLIRHGEQVHVRLMQWRDRKGSRHLMLTGVWNDEGVLEEFFGVREGSEVKVFDVWGYPCRTSPEGRTARELFGDDKEGKTYERFFFKSAHDGESLDGTILPLDAEQVARYTTVLQSYLAQQKEPGGDKHLLNRASTTYSASSDNALSDGDLVFVRLDRNYLSGNNGIPANAQVVDVFPTMVGRRAYSRSPRELAVKQQVLPLTEAGEASAADRLFGYVVPEAEDSAKGGDVASRGRLAFGAVDTSQAKISREKKKLSPLLSPKPSSARRFLTDFSGATPSKEVDEERGSLARGEYFDSEQFLGAAAYPVHREFVGGSGFPEQATKSPVMDGRVQDNDAVRLGVCSWVEVGSVLRCTMSFSNLSRDELAALIWVLTPENLVPREEKNDPKAVGYLRMGLGKPLGLGALEVRIADGGLRVVRGGDLSAAYEDLSGCLGESASLADPSEYPFSQELQKVLPRLPWVQALQRAAFGYADGKPVRYMSLKENRANNQTDSKTGEPKEGRGLSPQDLHGSDSHSCAQIPSDE